jgi:hypothetical protein
MILRSIWSNQQERNTTPEGHRKAKELCQQAIALDSNYLKPYIDLVHIWSDEARWGFSDSPEKALQSARDIARAAINIDSTSSEAYTAMGTFRPGWRQSIGRQL